MIKTQTGAIFPEAPKRLDLIVPQGGGPSPANVCLLSAICLVFLVIFASGCKEKSVVPPAAAVQVQVITLAPTNVPIVEEWVGTLVGYVNAQTFVDIFIVPVTFSIVEKLAARFSKKKSEERMPLALETVE